ncbi:MAG: amino acid permease [Spirochaetes bacterium GWF1_49_6]|nr:MAG: amino acid permease [Spirochaetes bacterium GWF1_49_6]
MALKKQLTSIDVFSLASGAMISTGIFVLPAIVFKIAGPAILISYFLAGVLILPALFSQLELATAIPKAGGSYFFAERILGSAAGTFTGFANWFTISLKSAFALVGIGAFATLIFPHLTEWELKIIAASFCVFFTVINLVSVKSSGKLQVVMVIALLVILGQFILFGYKSMDFSRVAQAFDFKWKEIFLVTGMVFISYGGLTNIASVAEEVKNPRKSLVLSTILAFVIVEIFYLLIILVLIGVMPPDELSQTLTPLSAAGQKFFETPILSRIELIITAVAAILAFVTTANAGIMTASRNPMSMSRDSLLPEMFAKVSKKKKIPYISVLFTSAFMLLVIFLLNLGQLAKVASLFMLLVFIMVNLSVIIIRFSRVSNYKPSFRAPLFPALQIAGIAGYLFLIFEMGWEIFTAAAGFLTLSIAWYFIYARKRVKRKSAFVHMVEKMVDPELMTAGTELEDELFEILMEMKEIHEDRFDTIIRKAKVFDLDHTVTRDDLFKLVADEIAKHWNSDPALIKLKLDRREEEASTVIYPGVAVPHAVPHIVIEGEHRFDIILVRDKHGIDWNDQGDVVYTAFFLIGTKDERNFHLKALMAIAQILQNPEFHKDWMQAKTGKELRSVILLTERQRSLREG